LDNRQPFLSIIIPAHNEEHRLPGSLEKICTFVASQTYPIEVMIVENGSQDRTFELAQEFAERCEFIRVVQEQKSGKGLAVRSGMLAARGAYRFICDADLSMPIEQVVRFIPPQLPSAEIAIASREIPGARRIGEPNYRHVIGRVFNTMVRWLALPGLQDTQCGFKSFRADVAEQIFQMQTMTGWSFDVEVLYIARKLGYPIQEVPIDWYYEPGSRVNLYKDSIRMALDLLTIRRNDRQGKYASQNKGV